ncbi:hypothetical protein ScPMuIL_003471, partial [Solemya velum]
KDRDIRALEREREQQEFELEKLRLQGIHLETSQEQGNVSMSESAHANMGIRPKLPYFEEDKDNMDAYLQRFERYAEVVGWAKQCWSLHVSALLKGKALEVYSRLTPDEAKDYDVLKKALLKRYELTEEGFRRKFKNSYPDKGESFDMFSRIGVPREILSDQGSQFTSDLMKEIYRLLSLKQLTSSVYHPICNGLVEKWNGTLKQILKRLCAEKPKDWDRYLSAVLFAYREVPQESLGFSPFEMLYGRTVRGPMMILKELWSKTVPEDEIKTTYQYV